MLETRYLKATGILVVILAYYAYKPIPDAVKEPWAARKVLFALKLTSDIAWIGEKMGFGTKLSLQRKLCDLDLWSKTYDGLEVKDTRFDGVHVRVYKPTPTSKELVPGIVLYHGGGWMWGSIRSHEPVALQLATRLGAVVISVGYRLAPEHPYPIPFEDCRRATMFFMENAKELGVDSSRIALAGDSAGGNLAAAVALKLRDIKFTPQPKLQILVYPLLQAVDLQLPAYEQNNGVMYGDAVGVAGAVSGYMGFPNNKDLISAMATNNHTLKHQRQKMAKYVNREMLPERYRKSQKETAQQVGDKEISHKISKFIFDPYFMPLMTPDLKGLPEAYIMTCEFDPLRDDGLLYTQRLIQSEVRVTQVNYEDGFHGIWNFIAFPLDTEVGIRSMDNMVEFIKNKL